jgi:hypothetical protein
LSIAVDEWRYRTVQQRANLRATPVLATVIAMKSQRGFFTAEKLAPMVGRLRSSCTSLSPEKLGATFRNR